jgi:cytoskeletal protein CcmA (bactofilin family)
MAAAPNATAPSGLPGPTAAPTARTTPRVPRIVDRGLSFHNELRADRWQAKGTVKVSGGVDAGSAEVEGTLSVGGAMSAGTLRLRGSLEVDGAVEVRERFFARGDLHCGAAVHAGDLDWDGAARVAGAVSVDRAAKVKGSLQAPSIAAGMLEVDGAAVVPGEVRALSLLADFRHRSALGSVRAARVRVRGHVPNLLDKVFFHLDPVTVDRIEADSVELEAVDVAFVRAKEIVLGRAAHLTSFEGTVVRRHATSTVGPESKSPAPYGLRR